jgi:hypothetical protein
MSAKALTLHQPWASFIAEGLKWIETRSWRTHYRGRIDIHAGKATPQEGLVVGDWCVAYSPSRRGPYRAQHYGSGVEHAPADIDLPLGAIVATAELVDCLPIVECDRIWRDYAHVTVAASALTAWRPTRYDYVTTDISDQRPYGDFAPGRWAWLLDDVKPTTERCPACLGLGDDTARQRPDGSNPACLTCGGTGRCAPVPTKGRQGLWEVSW